MAIIKKVEKPSLRIFTDPLYMMGRAYAQRFSLKDALYNVYGVIILKLRHILQSCSVISINAFIAAAACGYVKTMYINSQTAHIAFTSIYVHFAGIVSKNATQDA